jgi:GTP-binding protein YchF
MKLRVGLVGLPNVGKSTLFNALIKKAKAEVANYPFCTIEPNIGRVAIPDKRLQEIARKESSKEVTPATIEFVDIAGLVKGASKGAGLGNQFLAHIREVPAIAYVLRCFLDEEVIHVEGTVDPVRDAEILDLELILADLESLKRRKEKVEKLAKSDKSARAELDTLNKAEAFLENFKPLRLVLDEFTEEEKVYLQKTLCLLSVKPVIYVANVSEKDLAEKSNPLVKALKEKAELEGIPVVEVCAKVEAELVEIPDEEREDFLKALGIEEPGLNKLIREGAKLLDLITFFTGSQKEARAWLIKKGTKAPQAAGEIHSDMERGFICAEVISYDDYQRVKNLQQAKDLGLVRLEGRDYVVQDGDIIYFRFNV